MKKTNLMLAVITALFFTVQPGLSQQEPSDEPLYRLIRDLDDMNELASHDPEKSAVFENSDPNFFTRPETEQFEIGIWYGFTISNDNNQNGLRRADLKYQINEGNLAYAFYDDALALENKFLTLIEKTAPVVGAGFKHDWSKKFFTKAEIGNRFLRTEDDQLILNLENVYFFSQSFLAKLVTQYDVHQNENIFTAGGFLEYELLTDFRLEGGFFHSENLTLDNTFNERILITPKLKIKAFEIIGGAYYDSFHTPDLSLGQFGGAYGLFVFPIIPNLQGKVFFNYDKGFFDDDATIVSLGTNLKL
jgi:hypothetical protein